MTHILEELESLAKLATPGPWWIDSHGFAMVSMSNDHPCQTIFSTNPETMGPTIRHKGTGNLSHWINDHDATYIASVNPSALLELIEHCRSLQQRVSELESIINT